MAGGRRRKKTITSPPYDRFSDLPINIIETILVCLPLRDAVRTSILSRKWRYNWVGIPQLVFDWTFYKALKERQMSRKIRLIMTVYQVLLFHCGPIREFTLCISESISDIDQLIHFLSRKGVEDFTLAVGSLYKLPSSFYSWLQLRRLNLGNCVFKPPPVFKGFSRLISIDFFRVEFDAYLLGDFISSCPLLEELILFCCTDFDFLEIDAPMLKTLDISCTFDSICFKNTPLLESVIFIGDVTEDLELFVEGPTSIMIELFRSLPVIKSLRLDHRFIKLLTLGGAPEKLPFTLNHLKVLELYHICFASMDEVSLALCLIKSSPNLEKIMIGAADLNANDDEGPVLELLEVQYYSDFSLNQLRKLNMWHMHRPCPISRPEKEFHKLIVANSPLLV